MIFCQDHVSYNDFGDCNDEIAVAGIDFIGGGQFMAFVCKGRGASRRPYKDNDSGSSISSSISIVVERNSRSPGDDSAAYVVPDDATANILSAI
jgi:hypothetical protein